MREKSLFELILDILIGNNSKRTARTTGCS